MRRRAPSPYDAHCTMRWVLVKLPSFSERRILEPRRGHPACSNALTGGVGSCHRFAKDRSPESVDSLIRMCSSYLQAPTGTLLFPGPFGPGNRSVPVGAWRYEEHMRIKESTLSGERSLAKRWQLPTPPVSAFEHAGWPRRGSRIRLSEKDGSFTNTQRMVQWASYGDGARLRMEDIHCSLRSDLGGNRRDFGSERSRLRQRAASTSHLGQKKTRSRG